MPRRRLTEYDEAIKRLARADPELAILGARTHTTEFADGAVASDHEVCDQLGFLSQLGLMRS